MLSTQENWKILLHQVVLFVLQSELFQKVWFVYCRILFQDRQSTMDEDHFAFHLHKQCRIVHQWHWMGRGWKKILINEKEKSLNSKHIYLWFTWEEAVAVFPIATFTRFAEISNIYKKIITALISHFVWFHIIILPVHWIRSSHDCI